MPRSIPDNVIPKTGMPNSSMTRNELHRMIRLEQRVTNLESAIIITVTPVTSSPYTVQDSDYLLVVDDDAVGSEVTLTLPAIAGNSGLSFIIKKIGSTADVIVDGDGSETIDNALTATLKGQYESITVVSDGTEWWIT